MNKIAYLTADPELQIIASKWSASLNKQKLEDLKYCSFKSNIPDPDSNSDKETDLLILIPLGHFNIVAFADKSVESEKWKIN